MTTHQSQPRKLSLVNELSNMDQDYISRRINIELNRIDSNEYQEVLKIFNKKTRNMKDERAKQSYMLSLLDVVNQRKETDHGESQHRVYTRNYGCPEELAPSAEPATHHNYRVPPPPPPYSRERSQSEKTKDERSEDPAAIVEERPEKNIVRVGDYVILGNLGQGTFGKVKLAEHIVTKEKVAIKVIEKANIKTAKQRVSVQREVRLMRLLNHPHIIKVYDVLYEQDCIMIIMEYASGGELFEYIVQHGRVKEREARLFFRQIISAVDYCHKNSVIHRDLKPENLLLDSNKNLRIIDFGFGNTFHRESLLNTYCGSPFYAAPEMIKGIQYVGPEVDVWSLGVILYALISGRLPFDASSMGELYGKIAKGVYDVPDHFSDGAAHLISRMITLDPTDRATIQEVRQSAWVNVEHERLPESFLPSRPSFVLAPNDQSLMQLVSFGFDEGDARRALRRRDLGPHPITSLYHLLEETRSRIEQLELGDASTINKNLKAKETLRCNSDPPRETPLVSLKDEPIYRSDPSNIATVPTDPRDKAVGAAAPKHQTPIKAISKLTRPRIRVGNNCELHTMELTAIKPFENNRPQNPPSSTPNWPKPVANSTLGHESTATETDLFIRTPKSSAGYRPGITCNKPRTVYTKKMSLPTENGNQPNGPTRCSFTDSKEFRVVRAFFNASTTSFRPVAQIVAEVERVLNANEISYTYNPGTHVFSCKYFEEEEYKKEVMWDIEVCRIDRLTGHCLQLRRVQGNLWSYKRLAKRLIDGFSL